MQATYLSFVTITKSLGNIGETFYEGLKRMCKFFEIGGQKSFKKLDNILKSSKHFITESARRRIRI